MFTFGAAGQIFEFFEYVWKFRPFKHFVSGGGSSSSSSSTNGILQEGCIPEDGKSSVVLPIYKG